MPPHPFSGQGGDEEKDAVDKAPSKKRAKLSAGEPDSSQGKPGKFLNIMSAKVSVYTFSISTEWY